MRCSEVETALITVPTVSVSEDCACVFKAVYFKAFV